MPTPSQASSILAFTFIALMVIGTSYGLGMYFGVWSYPSTEIHVNVGESRVVALPDIAKMAGLEMKGTEYFLSDQSGGHINATAWDEAPDEAAGRWRRFEHWKHNTPMTVKFSKLKRYEWYVVHAYNGSTVRAEAEFTNCRTCRLLTVLAPDLGDEKIHDEAMHIWKSRPALTKDEVLPWHQMQEVAVGGQWVHRGAVIVMLTSEEDGATGRAEVRVDYTLPLGAPSRAPTHLRFKSSSATKYGSPLPPGTKYLLLEASRSKGLLKWSDDFSVRLTHVPTMWNNFWRANLRNLIVLLDALLIGGAGWSLYGSHKRRDAARPPPRTEAIPVAKKVQ